MIEGTNTFLCLVEKRGFRLSPIRVVAVKDDNARRIVVLTQIVRDFLLFLLPFFNCKQFVSTKYDNFVTFVVLRRERELCPGESPGSR